MFNTCVIKLPYSLDPPARTPLNKTGGVHGPPPPHHRPKPPRRGTKNFDRYPSPPPPTYRGESDSLPLVPANRQAGGPSLNPLLDGKVSPKYTDGGPPARPNTW